MKIVDTQLTETFVRLRLADESDPAAAQFWIDVRVPHDALIQASGTPVQSYADWPLHQVRRAILETAQGAIAEEIRRLRDA